MTRYAFRDTPAGPMPPATIRRELRTLGVTYAQVARWLGVTRHTVSWWLRLSEPDHLVDRRHAEAVLIAARCIAKGILEPSEAILSTLEWRRDAPATPRPRKAHSTPHKPVTDQVSREHIASLREQVAYLRAELDFYADYASYMLPAEDKRGPGRRLAYATYARPILEDGGRRARIALGEEEDADE